MRPYSTFKGVCTDTRRCSTNKMEFVFSTVRQNRFSHTRFGSVSRYFDRLVKNPLFQLHVKLYTHTYTHTHRLLTVLKRDTRWYVRRMYKKSGARLHVCCGNCIVGGVKNNCINYSRTVAQLFRSVYKRMFLPFDNIKWKAATFPYRISSTTSRSRPRVKCRNVFAV